MTRGSIPSAAAAASIGGSTAATLTATLLFSASARHETHAVDCLAQPDLDIAFNAIHGEVACNVQLTASETSFGSASCFSWLAYYLGRD